MPGRSSIYISEIPKQVEYPYFRDPSILNRPYKISNMVGRLRNKSCATTSFP